MSNYEFKRYVPYIKNGETLRMEKKLDAYIKSKPLPTEKVIGEKWFNIFLNNIPKDRREHYAKVGIPYGADGIYTLRSK
jgi:hypothetical protein